MELKSEKSIKEYLKTLPDDTIIKYYLDVEFTPFPVLIMGEYTRRFKRKTKDEIIKDLKLQTRLVRKKTHELGQMAKKKGYKISEQIIQKSGILGSRLRQSTKSSVKRGIKTSKSLKPSNAKHLELLEKLGGLKKAGIITHKEFQEKKKKILGRI